MMWQSNISMLNLKMLLLIALRAVLEGWKMDVVGKMKKKEMFWGRDLFIYYYC